MWHHAAREINERNRSRERVIQKESGLVRFEVGWQYFSRLQIRHLTRGERNQLANAFMKSGRGAELEQIRNFRTGVGLEVIPVTELMMRREKPACIRFDALERTNVVLKIDMPAGGVRVFFRLESGGNGYRSDLSQKLWGNGEKPSPV